MLLLIKCRYLEVTDHRMPPTIKQVLASPFVASATALVD